MPRRADAVPLDSLSAWFMSPGEPKEGVPAQATDPSVASIQSQAPTADSVPKLVAVEELELDSWGLPVSQQQ